MKFLDFLKPSEKEKSTQAYLDIAEIRDSIVVTKNGSLRLVMLCSTINIDLKTEEEQNILSAQYQNFLNSLDFPIQIVIQSRHQDLSSYLIKLNERLEQEQNELLRIQISDYINFLKELISQANIMDKKFYVVVPYQPPLLKPDARGLKQMEFEAFKKELLQRAGVVAGGLGNLGLRCVQLNTQELIELFYNTYNPEISQREKLLPAEELKAPIIEKGQQR